MPLLKKLTKKRLSEFKKIFEDKYEHIITALKTSDITVDADGDEVDVIQGATLNSMREKLSMRDLDTLRKLSVALDKIEDGTFGNCEGCGDSIGERRLEAMPGCSLCIDCAHISEKISKQFL